MSGVILLVGVGVLRATILRRLTNKTKNLPTSTCPDGMKTKQSEEGDWYERWILQSKIYRLVPVPEGAKTKEEKIQ